MTNSEQQDLLVFERRESAVRSYCRAFPKMFDRAVNAKIFGTDEKEYIDFLAGCASLNYGHNDPDMKQALIDFISMMASPTVWTCIQTPSVTFWKLSMSTFLRPAIWTTGPCLLARQVPTRLRQH